MGHNAGWLALGAGLAGGADVILIPEIPYDIECIAESIRHRVRTGRRFSIVAMSEGALSASQTNALQSAEEAVAAAKLLKDDDENKQSAKQTAKANLAKIRKGTENHILEVSNQLEKLTGLESRVTILGHVQRGGTPSAADRILATRLGTTATKFISEGVFNVMVAARGDGAEAVPLEQVVGRRKTVPVDHAFVAAARDIGICLGDETT